MGTAFAASTECTAHSNYKAAIIKAKERSTVVTGALTGHPVRVIANKLTRDFAELEKNGASPEELDRLGAGKLRAAVRDGDIDYGSVMIGQIAGMIAEVRPVNEIMQSIVQGIPKVMAELSSRI